MSSDPVHVDPVALGEIVRACCRGVGLGDSDSDAVAAVLVYADLRGQDAHGVARLPNYMSRVGRGLATGTDALRVVVEHGALRRIDAGRAIGPAAAVVATDLAIETAREHGVAVVGVGNANHFGAAGFYARRAATRGLIATVMSNGPKAVAPYGAAEPLLGTNPLAIGIPTGDRHPMVLDISTSAVPRGLVRRAAAARVALPEGAAVDASGMPTTDAEAALAGSILPFGGPKGSGLALAISLLSALVADAQLDDEMGPMESGSGSRFPLFPGTVGHVFTVVDPRPLTGERGEERVAAFAQRIHELPPAAGAEGAILPGERGDAIAAERSSHGVPLSREQLAELAQAARGHGLDEVAGRLDRLAAES